MPSLKKPWTGLIIWFIRIILSTDKTYYSPGEDSVHLSTIIENPNAHQLSARAYLKTIEGVLIDSVDLAKQVLDLAGENWTANLNLSPSEEFYKIALTVFDEITSDHFNVPNATRFTTVGPVVLDNISWTKTSTYYSVKPFLKNQSTVTTITNASVSLICNDPWVISITPTITALPDIPPGAIVSPTVSFTVTVNNSIFPGYFNFKVEVMGDGWTILDRLNASRNQHSSWLYQLLMVGIWYQYQVCILSIRMYLRGGRVKIR